MRKLIPLFFIFFQFNQLLADSILLKDGTTYDGLIINSTNEKVAIKKDRIIRILPKEHIVSYVFSRADFVQLNDSQRIKCKVLHESADYLLIVNSTGLDSLLLDNINNIEYNAAGVIEVLKFPQVGKAYLNEEVIIPSLRKGAFFSTSLGLLSNDIVSRSLEMEITTKPPYHFGIGIKNYLFTSNRSGVEFDNTKSTSFIYLTSNFDLLQIPKTKWTMNAGAKLGITSDDPIAVGASVGSYLIEGRLIFSINLSYMVSQNLKGPGISLGIGFNPKPF